MFIVFRKYYMNIQDLMCVALMSNLYQVEKPSELYFL